MENNDPAKAEKSFERAISLERGVSEYHLWLANAVGQQAQNASVVRQPFMARRIKAEFERAVELDPRSVEARNGLISYYLQAPAIMGGSVEKAREQARAIAALDVVQGHMANAQISWADKDTAATERYWREAITAIPDSVMPVINLANRLHAWGRTADAFALYDGYLARQPRNVPARFQLARLVAISGTQLPRGERVLRDLLADTSWVSGGWSPSRGAVHARLGDVLRKLGKTDEARAAYTTALSLDKDSQIAKDGLKALN
jgi:tetratricopeptide (TPR) repeat protein